MLCKSGAFGIKPTQICLTQFKGTKPNIIMCRSFIPNFT